MPDELYTITIKVAPRPAEQNQLGAVLGAPTTAERLESLAFAIEHRHFFEVVSIEPVPATASEEAPKEQP